MSAAAKETSQPAGSSREERVIELISPMVLEAGYEVVAVEILSQRQSVLRVYIDHLPDGLAERESAEHENAERRIGIEDCAKVSRTLDEPLDGMSEIEAIFPGGYELEVSSPGIERPLRQPKDYERFEGKEARIHVFRPLTAEELENGEYQKRNPRQKNFLGVLGGLRNQKVLLNVTEGPQAKGKKKKKSKAGSEPVGKPEADREILIPLSLISKANLEPRLEASLPGRKQA